MVPNDVVPVDLGSSLCETLPETVSKTDIRMYSSRPCSDVCGKGSRGQSDATGNVSDDVIPVDVCQVG